jgi:uncharacterized protein (TIGR02145 family)
MARNPFPFAAVIPLALAFALSCSTDGGGGSGSGSGDNIGKGSIVYQGQKYRTVEIGGQVWMAENLNYKVDGSKCYGEGGQVWIKVLGGSHGEYKTLTDAEVQANCKKYGRLYDWAAAMKVCPKGWHLPSNADWDKLYRFADGTSGTDSPYRGSTAGRYLKAKEGWNDYWGESGNGEDKFGFSALPGGYGGYSGGNFKDVGEVGNWWSSSEYDSSKAYVPNVSYAEVAYNNENLKSFLLSVRCVQD